MKTKTIELYEFDELSESAKAKVLETERYINTGYEWSKWTIEEWEGKLEAMGFDDPKISYSGFYSQGDGASFTCKRVDVAKFLGAQKAKGRFKTTLKALKNNEAGFNVEVERIDRQNSHEYTVQVTTEVKYIFQLGGKFEPEKLDREEFELRDFILETVRTLSRKIYKDLESEYEGLTSDEAVIDTIKANEYTFRSNGKMENA